MYHSNNTAPLVRVDLAKLRPTQLSVGYAEVEAKARQWTRLRKKRRKAALQEHVFPAVLGLRKDYFIVDHHHLGIALMEAGIEAVFVAVLADLSWLEPAVFWRTMEFRAWSHPYDHRGKRRDYRDMPQSLKKLQNDPYRSLAGMVRDAGGFAKDQAPFVEFLWADYFRPLVPASLIDEKPARATRAGVRLAQSRVARYLPGWSGKTPG